MRLTDFTNPHCGFADFDFTKLKKFILGLAYKYIVFIYLHMTAVLKLFGLRHLIKKVNVHVACTYALYLYYAQQYLL